MSALVSLCKIMIKASVFCNFHSTEVDLALYVGLKSHSLKNGILGNNLTILVGVPLFQQFNGLH